MQCVKCDICGKYVESWYPVNYFVFVNNFDSKEIKEIYQDCHNVLEEKVIEMIKERKEI